MFSDSFVELISFSQGQKLIEENWWNDDFKRRSMKIYGVGKNYEEAMQQIDKKIQHQGRYGSYDYASIDSLLPIYQDSSVYIYPSITFYRLNGNTKHKN